MTNFSKNLLLVFVLTNFPFSIAQAEDIGTVTKLKGKATILRPGNQNAENLSLGDGIPQDSSVLTSEKSFIQIALNDKSLINLGPSSKSIISNSLQNEEKGHLINLLIGKARVLVKERKQQNFIVKTRTASLGVRGTEFIANYEPQHKVTSLVTLKGAVEMEKKLPIDTNKTAESKSIVVKPGEFAATNPHVELAQPRPLAKQQITALTENQEMQETQKHTPTPNTGLVADLNTGLVFELNQDSGKILQLAGGEVKYVEGLKAHPYHGLVSQREDIDKEVKAINQNIQAQLPKESILNNSDPYNDYIEN